MSPTFREAATPDEREAVFRLRYEVYVDEMCKPYPTADRSRRRLTDPLDETGILMCAFVDGTLVAALRCNWAEDALADRDLADRLQIASLSEETRLSTVVCSRLVLAPRARRAGVVLVPLLAVVFDWGRRHGVKFGLCQSTGPLIAVFERLGFRAFGEPTFDPQSGTVQQALCLVTSDVAHLERHRSPLRRSGSAFSTALRTREAD